jgi:hypothetical protein
MISNAYRLCPLEHLDLIPHASLKEPCSTLLDLLPTLIGDHLHESFKEEQSIWRFFKVISNSISLPFSFAPWIDHIHTQPSSLLSQSPLLRLDVDPHKYQAHLLQGQNQSNQLQILFASQARFIPPHGRKVKWDKKTALDLCLTRFKSEKTKRPQICLLVSDYWDLKLMETYRQDFKNQANYKRVLIPTLLHGGLLTPMSYL